MSSNKGGAVGVVILIAIILFLLWGIGSCTRIFYDPFSDYGASSSAASETA